MDLWVLVCWNLRTWLSYARKWNRPPTHIQQASDKIHVRVNDKHKTVFVNILQHTPTRITQWPYWKYTRILKFCHAWSVLKEKHALLFQISKPFWVKNMRTAICMEITTAFFIFLSWERILNHLARLLRGSY